MAYVLSQKFGVFQICTPLLAGKAVNRPREYRMMDWRTGFCKFSPRILPGGRAKIRFAGQSPSRRDQAKFRGRANVRRSCFKTSDGERGYRRSRSAGLLALDLGNTKASRRNRMLSRRRWVHYGASPLEGQQDNGDPGRGRTCNLRSRIPTLYPLNYGTAARHESRTTPYRPNPGLSIPIASPRPRRGGPRRAEFSKNRLFRGTRMG